MDDCSKDCYVYLLTTKDEVFNAFKSTYKDEVKNQLEKKIKVLRYDKRGEFYS